ncbi:MAG TPA: hypothetical protein PLS28_03390, partial [Clostridiales bacterium]|nr:hypothetical protein [Clostridiales bacterium]
MKRRLHKCLAIILACILAVSCTGVAFAASSGAGGTPPEKPAGQESSGNASGGNAPNGSAPDGNAPNGGAPGEQSNGVDSYQAVKEYTENGTYRNETISSTGTDENAVLVSDGKQVFSGVSVSRTSTDSTGGDNASFYGVGAAVLAKGGSTYLSKSKIETDANGGTGVFAYGDGTAYVADTTINTSKDTSGALHVA